VARSPVRLALLFGGSALVTLAYIGGLTASVAAFGTSASIAQVGAVYLGASFIAAASPTAPAPRFAGCRYRDLAELGPERQNGWVYSGRLLRGSVVPLPAPVAQQGLLAGGGG
jgi:hypothetical protein